MNWAQNERFILFGEHWFFFFTLSLKYRSYFKRKNQAVILKDENERFLSSWQNEKLQHLWGREILVGHTHKI